jgi:Matrixin
MKILTTKLFILTFSALLLLFPWHSNFGFTLNNSSSLFFENSSVPVYLAEGFCDRIGFSEADLAVMINEAANRYWNTASTSRLRMHYAGKVSVNVNYSTEAICLVQNPSCEVNPVFSFRTGILVSCNENTAVNFPNDGIHGVTAITSNSDRHINGSVMLINNSSGNQVQLMSRDEAITFIAHELGHAIGLGHSPVRDSLMYYQSIPTRRSLGLDDVQGVTYLYPKNEPVGCGSLSYYPHNDSTLMSSPIFLSAMILLFLIFARRKSMPNHPRLE